MIPTDRFEPGDKALIRDSRGRHYLITLQTGGNFHFHRGIVPHDLILGEPDGCLVRTTEGDAVTVFRPTLPDFVLKMSRGAQVIYPKDFGAIIIGADVYPGAIVVEAGAGSGSLTMALLRAVGTGGKVISYEVREDFAEIARSNVESFMGKVANLEIRVGSVYDGIIERGVDRVILDLPEPWRALSPVLESLRPGGILAAYLPTILQVSELTEALRSDEVWTGVGTTETLVRSWHVEGRSVRPDHRMVAHTGFVTLARRLSGQKP